MIRKPKKKETKVKKPKSHIVMVDSAFGKKVGFVSQYFKGGLIKPMETYLAKGVRATIPARQLMQGSENSWLWMDEANNRVIICNLMPIDKTIMGQDELMVNIAQIGFDVAFARPMDHNITYDEPYIFTITEEKFQKEDVKMYTMTFRDILINLHPMVLKKIRLTSEKIMSDILRQFLTHDEKINLINHAMQLIRNDFVIITGVKALMMPDDEVNQRYIAAENLLFSYYYRDHPDVFPPNPFIGMKVLKGEVAMEYVGEKQWLPFNAPKPPVEPVAV